MGCHRATTYAATQLVKLRQTQAFWVFDNHQAGIGDVDTNFNHRSGDQQMQLALFEGLHDCLLLGGFHAAVNQADVELRQCQF